MRPRNLTSRGRRRAALFVFPSSFLLTSDFAFSYFAEGPGGDQRQRRRSHAASDPDQSEAPRGAFGAAIVCALLLLQYAHRRKPFILLWASGWLLIAPEMLLIARGYENGAIARLAVGLSQFLGICTATLFFWSADFFRQTRYVRPSRLRVLIAVGAWFVDCAAAVRRRRRC